MPGLIGRKIGMTRIFDEDGVQVPVTVIEAGPCPVVQVKSEATDGYAAVQIGFGAKKAKRASNGELGHAARAGLATAPRLLREFKMELPEFVPATPAAAPEPEVTEEEPEVEAAEAAAEGQEEVGEAEDVTSEAEVEDADGAEEADAEFEAAAEELGVEGNVQYLTVSQFEAGDRVKVTGRSKGRGFQGVVKRHGFAGRPASHGHPMSRNPGSMGPGTDPSRVIKGKKLPGRMGGTRTTIRNLQVVRVDDERNLLFVKGGVPGSRDGYVLISK